MPPLPVRDVAIFMGRRECIKDFGGKSEEEEATKKT
jgi:hypothetical protein